MMNHEELREEAEKYIKQAEELGVADGEMYVELIKNIMRYEIIKTSMESDLILKEKIKQSMDDNFFGKMFHTE